MAVVHELSYDVQERLCKEAMKAADALGYCDEAKNVLKEMGFDLPDTTVTLLITATFSVPFGTDPSTLETTTVVIEDNDYNSYETDDVYTEVKS